MREQEVRELYEAYLQVHQPQEVVEEVEELDEARTDPRGRPASGPMNVYGGRGQDAGPGGSGNEKVDRMDAAQRRVKATKPKKMGMAADALFTKYSARQKGMEHGGEEGPGPKAPKRSGRSGRGANTDRGSGNAAKRRMSEDFDLFDTILEHLVAEGYADTNESALAIMANMSEEWKEEILDEAAADQSDKQIDKGVKTTYKAQNVLDNLHQGRSRGVDRVNYADRDAKVKRMRGRLKTRRDDLFGERNKREDESRAEMKKKYGI
jgi:hypothetical protein